MNATMPHHREPTLDDIALDLAARHRRVVVTLALTAFAFLALANVCAIALHAGRYLVPVSAFVVIVVICATVSNLAQTRQIMIRFRTNRFVTTALTLRS